jgi:hypothetical protein
VRNVAIAGMAIAATGLAIVSGVPADGSYASDLLPGLLPMSLGMGLTFVPLTLIATTNIDAGDAGLASGIFNTAQQVGGALGLAVLSTLAANRTSSVLAGFGHAPTPADHASALVDGFQVAFAAGAGLIALGAVVLFVLIRPRDVAQIDARDAAVATAAA